jgi:hypothetical protein
MRSRSVYARNSAETRAPVVQAARAACGELALGANDTLPGPGTYVAELCGASFNSAVLGQADAAAKRHDSLFSSANPLELKSGRVNAKNSIGRTGSFGIQSKYS